MSEIQVVKRDGVSEPLDLEKMHKVVMFACQDIAGVSASEVELKSHIQFYDGITSEEIQETLIKAASDLISEETPTINGLQEILLIIILEKWYTMSLNLAYP